MLLDLSHIDITTLVDMAALKKVGREYKGPCPFCGGEDRFSVQPDKHTWICRNCGDGKYRDVVDYVQRRDNVDFKTACETLAVKLDNAAHQPRRDKPRTFAAPQDKTPPWTAALLQRGISRATIARYQITANARYWQYPIIGQRGGRVIRHKQIAPDGSGPKYWSDYDGRQQGAPMPDDVVYYSLGHLTTAIKSNNGVLWLSAGEPNTWVLHSAFCGGDEHYTANATFWITGERNVPTSLVDDLEAWGVSEIRYAPDCDADGIASAQKVRQMLEGSPIACNIYQLPGKPGSKYDLNDLWIDCNADPHRFQHALDTLPLFDFGEEPDARPVSTSSDTTIESYMARLETNHVIEGIPLVIPFQSWHRLGGFARVVMPKKMIGIIAPSGHGKTSFVETWSDDWLRKGFDGLVYGPEWSPDEYMDRRVQRYGGPSYNQMAEWELYKKEVSMGVPEAQRFGKALSDAQVSNAVAALRTLAKWPGKAHYFDTTNDIETLLQQMADELTILRQSGRKVTFAVFDYAQLLRNEQNDTGARYEGVVESIKEFVIRYALVGIVTSQVRKAESKENKQGKDSIDSDAALWLRDDKFNLFVGLNVHYEEDEYGERTVRTERATANISKNSPGLQGIIQMRTAFDRFAWEEVD